MSPFECFRIYRALKLHFTSESYDYFKYGGKSKSVTKEKFEQAKEKIWCQELVKKYGDNTGNFLLANISDFPTVFIKDLVNNDLYHTHYLKWYSYRKTFQYQFTTEINASHTPLSLKDLFAIEKAYGNFPAIITNHICGRFSKDTTCMLLKITDSFPYLDDQLKDNVFWKNERMRYLKYLPFVKQKDKYTAIVIDRYGTIDYK